MIQGILELFTTVEKAEAMLENSIIEVIFWALFIIFAVTLVAHLLLFLKLKRLRNYLKEANNLEMEPFRSFKKQFEQKQQTEQVKVETFVQERFSNWRVFNMPIVSLIKLIQMTVSIFILLGVLGTFIGLTISLGNIQTVEDQLVENITGVLSGIDVAFYTSIVGMSFSLIMTILLKALNTEYMLTDIMLMVETQLEGDEQNGMGQLIKVSEMINQSIIGLQKTNQQSLQSIEKAFTGFQEYTTGLQQSAKDLAAFNEGLSSNLADFQELFHQMNSVTEGFSAGTNQLNKNFDSLFSYFKKTDRRNERMAIAFEQTLEKTQEVSKAQIKTLAGFEDSVNDIKNYTSSLLEEQAVIHSSFEKTTQKNHELVDKMDAHNREFKQVFGSDLGGKLSAITNQLGKLSNDFDKLGQSIIQLPDALEVINETQQEYKHLLSDRFRELKEFNQTFSHHLKEHSTQSATFEKHMLETARTYEQFGSKNNQLIAEIDSILSRMNQTFGQREHQIEANVGILKETLANYVSSLEGTLGDKLEKVVRNIDNTTHGMKREFTEIRRGTEEIQQNSYRAIQQLLQELAHEFQTLNRQLNSVTARSQQPIQVGSGMGMRHNDY